MVVRIPLSSVGPPGDAGYDRLLVVGAAAGTEHDETFRQLFEAHRSTRGLEVIPPGTPTNTTEQSAGDTVRPTDSELFAAELERDRAAVPGLARRPGGPVRRRTRRRGRRRARYRRAHSGAPLHLRRPPAPAARPRGERGTVARDVGSLVRRSDAVGGRRSSPAVPRRADTLPHLVRRLRPRRRTAADAARRSAPVRAAAGDPVRGPARCLDDGGPRGGPRVPALGLVAGRPGYRARPGPGRGGRRTRGPGRRGRLRRRSGGRGHAARPRAAAADRRGHARRPRRAVLDPTRLRRADVRARAPLRWLGRGRRGPAEPCLLLDLPALRGRRPRRARRAGPGRCAQRDVRRARGCPRNRDATGCGAGGRRLREVADPPARGTVHGRPVRDGGPSQGPGRGRERHSWRRWRPATSWAPTGHPSCTAQRSARRARRNPSGCSSPAATTTRPPCCRAG